MQSYLRTRLCADFTDNEALGSEFVNAHADQVLHYSHLTYNPIRYQLKLKLSPSANIYPAEGLTLTSQGIGKSEIHHAELKESSVACGAICKNKSHCTYIKETLVVPDQLVYPILLSVLILG